MKRRSFIALILGCLGLSRFLPKAPKKVYMWTSPTYRFSGKEKFIISGMVPPEFIDGPIEHIEVMNKPIYLK